MADRKWWLRSFRSAPTRVPLARPRLESLDERAMPATLTWSGAAGDGLWTNAGNWDFGAPVNGDDLIFPSKVGTGDTSTNNYKALSVRSLTVGIDGYTLDGNELEITQGGILFGDVGNLNITDAPLADSVLNLPVRLTTAPVQTIRFVGTASIGFGATFSKTADITLSRPGLGRTNVEILNENNIDLLADGTVNLATTAEIDIIGRIRGFGDVTTGGDGLVRFRPLLGNNDYVGDTLVRSGRLDLNPGDGLPASIGTNTKVAIPGFDFRVGNDGTFFGGVVVNGFADTNVDGEAQASSRAGVFVQASNAIGNGTIVFVKADGAIDFPGAIKTGTTTTAAVTDQFIQLNLGTAPYLDAFGVQQKGGGGTVTGLGEITLSGRIFPPAPTLIASGAVDISGTPASERRAVQNTVAPTVRLTDNSHLFVLSAGISATGDPATLLVSDVVFLNNVVAPVGNTVFYRAGGKGGWRAELQGINNARDGFYDVDINSGTLVLFDTSNSAGATLAGSNVTVPGNLFIGGGGRTQLRANDQIRDFSVVTFAGGELDLSLLGGVPSRRNETVQGLNGDGLIRFGTAANVGLAVLPFGSFNYAGEIDGAGIVQVIAPPVQFAPAGQVFSRSTLVLDDATNGPFTLQAFGGNIEINSEVVGAGGGARSGPDPASPTGAPGVIFGSGSLEQLDVQFGGAIDPGTTRLGAFGRPGTLTTGALQLDGTFRVRIESVDSSGQIVVLNDAGRRDPAALTLPTLEISLPDSKILPVGTVFTILDIRPRGQLASMAGSGFNSTTGVLTEGSVVFDDTGRIRFLLSFVGGDGNDVTLTVLRVETGPSLPIITRDFLLDPPQAAESSGSTATFLVAFAEPTTLQRQPDPDTVLDQLRATLLDPAFPAASRIGLVDVRPIIADRVTVTTTGGLTFSGVTVTAVTRPADPNDPSSVLVPVPGLYRVTVTGLRGDGTVAVSLPNAAAFSIGGFASQPSLGISNFVDIIAAPGASGGGLVVPGPQQSPFVLPLPRTPATRFVVGADAGGNGAVNVYQGTPNAVSSFRLPTGPFANGVRVATADFNRDGVKDYVFATGPGVPSLVQVYDGVTGAMIFSIAPFEESFLGGVNIAVGNLNGDDENYPELVIGPDIGGGPRVQVYDGKTFEKIADFFGIDDPNFRGGVRLAVGNIDGSFKRNPDGTFFLDGLGEKVAFNDLIVAAGFGGGPRVAIFNGGTLAAARPVRVTADFFAFEQGLRNGVNIASLDVNDDGFFDVVAGGGPGGSPRISVYSGKSLLVGQLTPLANFFAGDPESRSGIRVAATDYNGDGTLELVTGDAPGDGSTVQVFRPINIRLPNPVPETRFEAFENFGGGVWVG